MKARPTPPFPSPTLRATPYNSFLCPLSVPSSGLWLAPGTLDGEPTWQKIGLFSKLPAVPPTTVDGCHGTHPARRYPQHVLSMSETSDSSETPTRRLTPRQLAAAEHVSSRTRGTGPAD